MNQSTMLAQRTRKLIEEVQPDMVCVQSSPEWFAQAKLARYVDSQEEFNRYMDTFEKYQRNRWLEYFWSTRKFVFMARFSLYYVLFQWHYRWGHDFRFWRPGLEVKFALEAAEKVGAKVNYLGTELNSETWDRLYHETRMNAPHYIAKRVNYMMSPWSEELNNNR